MCLCATAWNSWQISFILPSPSSSWFTIFCCCCFEATSCATVPVASRGDFGPDPPFVSHRAVSSVSTAGLAPLPTPVFSMQKLPTRSAMWLPHLHLPRSSSDRPVCFASEADDFRWRGRDGEADSPASSLWQEMIFTAYITAGNAQVLLNAATQEQTSTHTKAVACCLYAQQPFLFSPRCLSLWGYIKASYKQPCSFGPCLTWLFLQRCKTLCLPLASGREWGKGEGRLNETTKWRFERKIANFHPLSGLYSRVHFVTLLWNVLFDTIKIIWVEPTPESFFLSCLVFPAGLSSAEYQQQGKASCVSANWTLGDPQLEVVNTATGRRRESGTPSRLCKHALFTRWNRLYRKVRPSCTRKVESVAQEREYVRGIHLVTGSIVCYSEIHRQCEVSGSWNASKTRIIWITGTSDPTDDN